MHTGRLLVLLLAAGSALLYLYPDYRNRLVDSASAIVAPVSISRTYKWRDGTGQWQLTDSPPPEGVSFEILEHRPDENILPRPPQLSGRGPDR